MVDRLQLYNPIIDLKELEIRQVHVCLFEIFQLKIELKSPLQQTPQKATFDFVISQEKRKNVKIAFLYRSQMFLCIVVHTCFEKLGMTPTESLLYKFRKNTPSGCHLPNLVRVIWRSLRMLLVCDFFTGNTPSRGL